MTDGRPSNKINEIEKQKKGIWEVKTILFKVSFDAIKRIVKKLLRR